MLLQISGDELGIRKVRLGFSVDVLEDSRGTGLRGVDVYHQDGSLGQDIKTTHYRSQTG